MLDARYVLQLFMEQYNVSLDTVNGLTCTCFILRSILELSLYGLCGIKGAGANTDCFHETGYRRQP